MLPVIWAAPLLAAIGLLASGRASALAAGIAGTVLTALVAATVAPAPLSLADEAVEIGKGAWLAWQAVAVIVAGLFFYLSTGAGTPEPLPATAGTAADVANFPHRRLYAACFLLGPFAESATGFGVGYVIALSMILRLGIGGLPAIVLGLFSQMLVPWGALAVGTVIGAQLADLPLDDLGTRSAVLTVPLLFVWLLLFWRFAAAAGHSRSRADKADDLLWTAAIALLLPVANRWIAPEVAVVVVLGPLLAIRFLRDGSADAAAATGREAFAVVAPYAALVAILVATRVVPPLHGMLAGRLVIVPFAGRPGFDVLLHPSTWLIAVAVATVIARGHRRKLPHLGAETWRRSRRAVGATVLFLVMADLTSAAGIAGALAGGLEQAIGRAAIVISPCFAAVAGFLTGSNAASNALLMPINVALATATGADGRWLAALQNTIGSAFTMLSPMRVVMGCALLARGAELERRVYAVAWPLGAAPLAVIVIAAMLVLLLAAGGG